MSLPQNLIIEADGGSRGNPGPAGSGAVVIDADTGLVIAEIARFIGVATNNVAEYVALQAGLEAAFAINAEARVLVRMDSKLVIEQMSGGWKIKHPDMIQLGAQVQKLVAGKVVRWMWIPREDNSKADALANKAMDDRADSSTVPRNSKPKSGVAEFNHELPSSVRAPGGVTEPLTTIVLVRHGRTHLTESKRISGRGGENPQLSALGREDATAAANALSQFGQTGSWAHLKPIDAIVASPVARTHETANIIGAKLGLDVATNENIAEISFGDWDGHTNEEVFELWPEQFAAWQGSWTVAPPAGESLEEFDARILEGLASIQKLHAGKTVAVVSHVMPIRGFVRAAMDAGIAAYWRPSIAPCSITVLRFWGNQAAEVLCVNATSHL
ncbi:bifunctional RNase H/acid phosphatase [Rhodoluna sp.]|uniref:bifunctional RNase H/acid phosphatase n=1 Tax=Rhodoluna sp. TaxID=1969481 RepID=UPI0025DA6E2D|nr:bifunctional RNase H/acid phosphatase [Rhodoluna sp.]